MLTLNHSQITAVIGALVASELAAMRNDDEQFWQHRRWSASTRLSTSSQHPTADELLIDSLEWLSIASRVAQFFQLDKAGVDEYLLRAKTLGDWADVVVASRKLGYCDITFSSSGSTGAPQPHQHSWQTLCAEAESWQQVMVQHDIAASRVISIVPPHHIYGFIFSVLLPQLLDIDVVRGFSAFNHVHTRQLQENDLLIGFPSWYQQLAQQGMNFTTSVHAVCSAGVLASDAHQQLTRLGIDSLLEVYGSSETAGVGYRLNSQGPYLLSAVWQRDDADPEQITHCLTQQSHALPDHVEWIAERKFYPLKRRDHGVKLNGHKIYPQHIAEILAEHPSVSTARVRINEENHPPRLSALVIPTDDIGEANYTDLQDGLPTWLRQRLPAFAIPQQLTLAKTIPTNSMGKETRWDDTATISE